MARRLFLILIFSLAVVLTIFAFWVSLQPCEGLGCIGIGISLAIAEGWWLILAGALPILFAVSSEHKENILRTKELWITGILILFVVSSLWFFATSHVRVERPIAQQKSRDSKRIADMSYFSNGMRLYYDDHGNNYLISNSIPTKIEGYIEVIDKDPGNGPCENYKWISNVNNPQKYCAWACLEERGYYAVSHKGSKKLVSPPQTLECE